MLSIADTARSGTTWPNAAVAAPPVVRGLAFTALLAILPGPRRTLHLDVHARPGPALR